MTRAGSSNRPGTRRGTLRRLRPDPDPGPAQRRGTRAHLGTHRLGRRRAVCRRAAPAGRPPAPAPQSQDRDIRSTPCPGCASRRSRSVRDSRTLTVPAPARRGSRQAWRSPPGTVLLSSRATSTAASAGASLPPRCRLLTSTAPGRPAGPCWQLRTYTRATLAALDVHPRDAMQILRHSKIAVTMGI